MKKLQMDSDVFGGILTHGRSNRSKEVCGIFTGKKSTEDIWVAKQYHEIENVDEKHNKHHYELHPQQFMDVISTTTLVDSGNDKDFLGIFHTHPHHHPTPSSIDIDNAGYIGFYVIYSPKYDSISCSFCHELKEPWNKANFEII